MKVADLLESRRGNWRELQEMCYDLENRRKRRKGAQSLARFASLYRATCADLAMADAYHLPPGTVHYLHQLVGRAHNQLYRSRTFNFRAWGKELFLEVPQRLYSDNCLRLAFFLFWGFFLASMYLSSDYTPLPAFASNLVGAEQISALESMYSDPIGAQARSSGSDHLMMGYYVNHNAGIGLRCFAAGLLAGVGGLFATVFNAMLLGAMFGHMTRVPQSENFFHFVTAHGPFELTAIILSAAAGMRLGFSMINARGFTRIDSLRQAAREVMPTAGAAALMFVVAAMIEGYISPSPLPYSFKAAVSALSCGLLAFYFVALGVPREGSDAVG